MGPRPFFENQITLHGTLVWIGSEGILLLGEAGAGKSTAALGLMGEGAQLVADDVVVAKRLGSKLIGTAPPVLKGILAVPELGIFDIRDVFGPEFYKPYSGITRCIEIGRFDETTGFVFDREILGVSLPRIYREPRRPRNRPMLPPTIDFGGLKRSESRFLQFHSEVLAASRLI